MRPLKDLIMTEVNNPNAKSYLYQVGQIARVLNGVSNDGQIPDYWDGAKVRIISRHLTLLYRYHIYKVEHLTDNQICQFEENELDKRFSKKG